jgi:hypothetical protein
MDVVRTNDEAMMLAVGYDDGVYESGFGMMNLLWKVKVGGQDILVLKTEDALLSFWGLRPGEELCFVVGSYYCYRHC